MKKLLSLVVICICALNFCAGQANHVEADIDFRKEQEGFVTISAIAQNLSDYEKNYSFSMDLVKSESGNSTNSKQSGNFTLAQKGGKTLSTIKVNLSGDTQFEVNLKIYDGEKSMVAQQILKSDQAFFDAYKKLAITPTQKSNKANNSVPLNNQKQQQKKPQIDAIEIGGLIIDDTRSKIGRDFYDLFYGKWTDPVDAPSFSITIKELPARGRVSRVAIEVDGNVVIQRMVQPRQDVMEILATQSVSIVKNYLSKKKEMNKELESEDQSGSGIF